MDLVHENGRVTELADLEAPLCRCGHSQDKRWCDYTHRDVDFDSRGT